MNFYNKSWIHHCEKFNYPEFPFNPSAQFEELPLHEASPDNHIFGAVRSLLNELGLNNEKFGKKKWNPIGDLVDKGSKICIKPNYVIDRNSKNGDIESVITHTAVLRPIIEYSLIAVGENGKVIVADTPQMDCKWEELMKVTKLNLLQNYLKDIYSYTFDIVDCRPFEINNINKDYTIDNRCHKNGDPSGSITLDLGNLSMLSKVGQCKYYGADYNTEETNEMHSGNRHIYQLGKTFMDADLLISVPKLKTHKKVGVTINCKGFVGLNTNKNCLVHYRLGSAHENGDQFPAYIENSSKRLIKIERFFQELLLSDESNFKTNVYHFLKKCFKFIFKHKLKSSKFRYFDGGNWSGNDSAWRMTSDLAYIIKEKFKFDRTKKEKSFMTLVDGVIGGELEGPLRPDGVKSNSLIAGFDPFFVDIVSTILMGFDYTKIKYLNPRNNTNMDLTQENIDVGEVYLNGNKHSMEQFSKTIRNHVKPFKAHAGWDEIS